jgi:hypothetical protein
MADGMDMVRIVTKRIGLDEVTENIAMLRDDRAECKITCVDFD